MCSVCLDFSLKCSNYQDGDIYKLMFLYIVVKASSEACVFKFGSIILISEILLGEPRGKGRCGIGIRSHPSFGKNWWPWPGLRLVSTFLITSTSMLLLASSASALPCSCHMENSRHAQNIRFIELIKRIIV